MKKCFSFLLTLLVLLAIPVSAFAADDVFTPAQKAYYKNLGLQGTTVNVYIGASISPRGRRAL